MKNTNKHFIVGVFAGVGLGILAAEAWAMDLWKELAILICLAASIARYYLCRRDQEAGKPQNRDKQSVEKSVA